MSNHETEFARADSAAEYVLRQTNLRPRIALVLGSGLSRFAEEFAQLRIPYTTIPNFPPSTALGHPGQLAIGTLGGIPLVAMQGRVHLYEGYSAQQIAFPIRLFRRMGVRAAILTNASGAINLEYKPGDLVLIRDHLNLQGQNPLVGDNDNRFGPRFVDLTHAYSRRYREIAHQAATIGKRLQEGVYAAVLGPSYETPAEISYLHAIGADLVGMSTVPEVIAARQLGIDVLAISCVTNMAAGILDRPLDHIEVLETAERAQADLATLLRAVIPEIAAELSGPERK
jgi:purine-nucleoside phosphorylase